LEDIWTVALPEYEVLGATQIYVKSDTFFILT